MGNFTKSLLILLLVSGSFTTYAMDNSLDRAMADSLGVSLNTYLECKATAELLGVSIEQCLPEIKPISSVREDDEDLQASIANSITMTPEEISYRNQANSLGIPVEDYRASLRAEKQTVFVPPTAKDKMEQGMADSLGMTLETYRNSLQEASLLGIPAEDCRASLRAASKIKKGPVSPIISVSNNMGQTDMGDSHKIALKFAFEEYQNSPLSSITAEESQASLTPFKNQVYAKTNAYSFSKQRPLLEEFVRIRNDLRNILQGYKANTLDHYVFGTGMSMQYGSGNNIEVLLEIGRLYDVDNPKLSLAEVGQQMVQFINQHTELFVTCNYPQLQSTQQITEVINMHFSKMDTKIGKLCPAARETWSRAWTLASNLFTEDHNTKVVINLFFQVVNWSSTREGCPEELINRGFIGYSSVLEEAGVRLHTQK